MAYSPSNSRHLSNQSVTTTDATVTTIKTIPIKGASVARIIAIITGKRTGGTAGNVNDAASYWVTATVKAINGTATIVGAVAVLSASEDQVAWDGTIDVSGGTAIVTVAGAANNNVTWNAKIEVIENL
ncbi:MAG: hypothetical protein WC776_04875 [Patescibacteria group bacterium]|jgi:hypothetical protein